MAMLDTLLEPDRREEAVRHQADLRERFGHRVPHHPALVNYRFGCAREVQVLSQLQALSAEDRNDSLRVARLFLQLAESYALQARFEEAEIVAPDAAYKAVYQAQAAALAHCDVRRCACPLTIILPNPHDAKGHVIPSADDISEVWDGNVLIVFSRCRICTAISARRAAQQP